MPTATTRGRAVPEAPDPVRETAPTDGRATPPVNRWAGSPPSRADLFTSLAIAVVVMVIATVWRTALVPTDPWHYVRSALEFPSANWVPLGYTRYGIILANILPGLMFKNAQATYYFWAVISSGALVGVVYLLGRRWWGRLGGAVAAVVLLANTVVLLNLSRGYPDIMSVSITMLAVYLALLARDRLLAGGRATVLLLTVGALLGWGFEVRETTMFLWPLVAVILWHRPTLLRAATLVALPVMAWAAIDIGISAIVYGDPLLKLHTLTGSVVPPETTATGEPAPGDIVGKPRSFYFLMTPRTALQLVGGTWIVGTAVVAMVAVVVRNWPIRLLSASFILMYLLNVLPAGGLDPAKPRGRLTVARYWIQYFPSVALIIGGLTAMAAWALARRLGGTAVIRRRAIAGLAALAVVAYPVTVSVEYLLTYPAFAPNGGDAMERLRDELRGKDFRAPTLWTDWETKRMVPPYQRDFFGGEKVWNGQARSLTGPGEPEPGDYVLLFSARSATCGHCRTALRPWLKENPTVPEDWQLVHTSETGNLQLYRVLGG
jgi:hypothetical protein